ncbi:MAG: esterase [Deltaproteobacteria bacterium]|nr:dienelactone hydrolase family protein [Deltaproteobacteria bacterium]MBW2188251.1 dienelactone hydrolase family protein [Deltaproteobacteria bacterium]MBW2223137.1 dienelactone hydrolase family protein [Deltaproteobacteria bacterium]MBW2402453.1 dienelactone hydrolase family protein [Deltaproteobacteria bacterium]MBW2547004.1 dienelactone hydrolase family protein [Deltaproteobacteria bacterium]
MREERFGGVNVRLTGGEDREGGGDGPLVVLMHGFGAPGTDLVGLWRVLDVPRSVRFAFPEAPNEIPGMPGAKAWWALDLARTEQAMAEGPRSYAAEIPPGMEEATDQVVQMIDAMQEVLGVPNERLIVGGFSQGSMAACNAVFTRNLSLAALVILSGTPVNLAAWKAGMAPRSGVPVFQSHGQQDPLLSFQAAEELNKEMRDAGLATQWVPFRGGHELPVPVLEGLSRFLSAIEAPI